MGAVNSCCIPKRSGADWHENHSRGSKLKNHRRNLSATFNMAVIEDEPSQNLININYATEEELMTLPGINRVTAKNIIEYRRKIGGFKKVEDVALVTGVGAAKLNTIRGELTLSIKQQTSLSGGNSDQNSLNNSNLDMSIDQNGKGDYMKQGNHKVNINTANVFQLMKINGIGQVLGENIVSYRDKKGPFRSVDELVKVKGIGPNVLSAIRSRVTISDSSVNGDLVTANGTIPGHHSGNNISSNTHNNHGSGPPSSNNTPNYNNHGSGPPSTNNTPNCNNSRLLTTSTEDLLNMLGQTLKSSSRPEVTPFKFKHKNRNVIRIATWNVEQFDEEKANNPGVREVICMTILENGLGLVAFQELADEVGLQKICDELNKPTLPKLKRWTGHRGVWSIKVSEAAGRMYRSSEYNGFLYDSTQGIELTRSALLEKPKKGKKPFVRRPFIGVFKIKKFDCVVVSVHLKATGLHNEDLDRLQEEIDRMPKVVEAIEDHYPGEKDIILLGDFNLEPNEQDFDCVKNRGFKNCIPEGSFTNISNKNTAGSRTYDHIWLTEDTYKVFSGNSGVIRDGLTNPLIPNGWTWGGVVSDHCPVWTEIYTGKDLDKEDLSKGAEAIKFTLGTDG